ncbi:MAG: hypothetical protein JHC33_01015 [Ignisphaera sp.]|nr:hypothetical protein [Ignisphaera sp.]
MNSFIVISPDGWTQYRLNDIFNVGLSLSEINDNITSKSYSNTNEVLTNAGVLVDGWYVVDMKVFPDDDVLWVLLTQ